MRNPWLVNHRSKSKRVRLFSYDLNTNDFNMIGEYPYQENFSCTVEEKAVIDVLEVVDGNGRLLWNSTISPPIPMLAGDEFRIQFIGLF